MAILRFCSRNEARNTTCVSFVDMDFRKRVSIFDALGMAGDLQINAKRKNVLVMREDGDEKVFAQLDLTSENIIHSPFFYLQQNEDAYVEPNKARIVGGNAGAFLPYVLSSISTLVAILAIAIR